ncbi:MAG TPA: zf-HC2 domain-containing protein [Candidatus Xenobia bacterium]
MTCNEVIPQLPAWMDGDLPAPAATALQHHLEGCAACAAEKRAVEQAWAMLDDAPVVQVAGDFRERFWERARGAQPEATPAAVACAQVREWLPAFDEGDLLAGQLASVEVHLDGCSACVAEHSALQQAWTMLDAWQPTVEVRSDFNHRFWQRVEAEPVSAWQKLVRDLGRILTVPTRAVAGLAVVLVLMVGGVQKFNTPPPPVADVVATIGVPTPEDDAAYNVMGDVADALPDLDQAAPLPKKAAPDDESIDRVLQEMPLDEGGPKS